MPAVPPQFEERLAAIAAAGTSQAEVLNRLLRELMGTRAVCGGGIWAVRGGGVPECRTATGDLYEQWLSNGGQHRNWVLLRQESLQSGERRMIPCPDESDVSATIDPNSGGTLVHWPLPDLREPQLIEVLFGSEADDASRREVLQFLQRAEVYFATAAAPAESPSTAAPANPADWDAFVLNVHRSLQLNEVCFAITNDGRRLIGCDRVCVLVRAGTRLRLASVSGVDLPDRRSSVVQAIECVAASVLRTGRPCIYRESAAAPIPAELTEYADTCHVRSAMLVPLGPQSGAETDACGLLMAEWFTQADPAAAAPAIERVAEHAIEGVRNALQHAEVAWARALLPVQWARGLWFGGRNRWTAAVLGGVGVAALALVLIPAPLVVTATGELQPRVRQHVYAPLDGIVDEVLTQDDADVAAGATLLRMSNSELEFELQRVLGAIETWQEKLSSIGILRLDGNDRREKGGGRSARRETRRRFDRSWRVSRRNGRCWSSGRRRWRSPVRLPGGW